MTRLLRCRLVTQSSFRLVGIHGSPFSNGSFPSQSLSYLRLRLSDMMPWRGRSIIAFKSQRQTNLSSHEPLEFAQRCAVGASHQICEDGGIDIFGKESNRTIAENYLASASVPTAESRSDRV